MPQSVGQHSLVRSRRLFGGAGVLVFFCAFFVAPLCAALALCAMPCCHHESGNHAASFLSADMGACETECSTRAEQASSDVVLSVAQRTDASRSAHVVTAIDVVVQAPPVVARVDSRAVHSARGTDAPFHILNSTLRI